MNRHARWPRVIVATMVTMALTACSTGSDPHAVRFWSFTGIGQSTQVEQFLQENPDASVELSEVGTSIETANALSAALAAGSPPDLVLIQADELPRFLAASDQFTDLRRFGAEERGADFLPWAWQQGVARSGEIIAIPTDVGGMSLAYRADLFEAAGLPTDPAEVAQLWPTWSDLIDIGRQYTARTGEPFIDNVETTVFANTANQLDTAYYGSDGALIYETNAPLRAAFDLALRAHSEQISAGMPAFSTGWSTGMSRGAFAVMPAPSWMLRVIKETAPELAGHWRIASAPGVAGNWGGSYLAIPSKARNPEAAWRYISTMQSAERQLAHFADGGPLPAAQASYLSSTVLDYRDDYFGDSDIGRVLADSLTEMTAVPRGPDTSVVNQAFLRSLAAVEQGTLTPDRAWESAVESIALTVRR